MKDQVEERYKINSQASQSSNDKGRTNVLPADDIKKKAIGKRSSEANKCCNCCSYFLFLLLLITLFFCGFCFIHFKPIIDNYNLAISMEIIKLEQNYNIKITQMNLTLIQLYEAKIVDIRNE